MVLDTVFVLPAVSVASHAETYDVTAVWLDGVTVHVYTVELTGVKLLIVALVTLTSQPVKLVVDSLNVQVTMKLVHEKYDHTLLVRVMVGATESYSMVSEYDVDRFPGVSRYLT